jgi:type II secretion system protein H
MLEPAVKATRRARDGFTLIELMVVVAIVAVVAAAAAPSIGAAVRDRKAATATLDVVRTFRGARASAAGYGRAYTVSYDQSANDDQGELTVRRGITNRCTATAWNTATATVIPGLAYTPERHRITDDFKIVLANANFPTLHICYEPTGITYWSATLAGPFSNASPTSGGTGVSAFRFTIDRFVGSVSEGAVQRYVVVPLGGDARVAR